MYNNKFLSDFSFIVENKRLYSHKIILATRCDYFASFFSSGTKESQASEITINEFSYDVFSEFLRYIYTGKVNSNFEIAIDLMRVGHHYKMELLILYCEMHLSKYLTVENSCKILEVSYKYLAVQLQRIAIDFIIKNLDRVSLTKGYEEMDSNCMKEFLTSALQRLKIS